MKILIIGGAGYIGGVTAHIARETGHTVTVIDNLSSGRRHNIPEDAHFFAGDVRDRQFVQTVFTNTSYDIVMHFAGRILVPESMKMPYDYFATNSFGALNCIDTAASSGVKGYIFSSSAAVYGEPAHIPLTENDRLQPVNPYGWSKMLSEQIMQSYRITHNLEWAGLRYFNVAGAYNGVGTDYPFVSHLIPSLLARLKTKEPIVIHGDDYDTPDGTCIRDYVHVADIARAHMMAAEKIGRGEPLDQPINLSSGRGFSVKEVADTFNDVTGAGLPIVTGPRRTGDPARLYAANDRATHVLGWRPAHGLRTIIQDHYTWYMAQSHPNQPIAASAQ